MKPLEGIEAQSIKRPAIVFLKVSLTMHVCLLSTYHVPITELIFKFKAIWLWKMAVLVKQRKRQKNVGQLWDLSNTQSASMDKNVYEFLTFYFQQWNCWNSTMAAQNFQEIESQRTACTRIEHVRVYHSFSTSRMCIIDSPPASIYSIKAFKLLVCTISV